MGGNIDDLLKRGDNLFNTVDKLSNVPFKLADGTLNLLTSDNPFLYIGLIVIGGFFVLQSIRI